MVEGYIANSLPLHQDHLNCLLPAEESEQVGQVNSEQDTQAIETYESYLDLSNNNSNSPIAQPENGELTLYGFSQFDNPEMRIEMTGTTDAGVPVQGATPANQTIQPVQPTTTDATYNQPSSISNKRTAIKTIMKQGRTFNKYILTINIK